MSDLNHAVLWRSNPVADYDLKFKDFLHVSKHIIHTLCQGFRSVTF